MAMLNNQRVAYICNCADLQTYRDSLSSWVFLGCLFCLKHFRTQFPELYRIYQLHVVNSNTHFVFSLPILTSSNRPPDFTKKSLHFPPGPLVPWRCSFRSRAKPGMRDQVSSSSQRIRKLSPWWSNWRSNNESDMGIIGTKGSPQTHAMDLSIHNCQLSWCEQQGIRSVLTHSRIAITNLEGLEDPLCDQQQPVETVESTVLISIDFLWTDSKVSKEHHSVNIF